MSLELIVAAGIIAVLFVYVAKSLDKEFLVLQLFFFAIALLLCVVITKGVYDSKETCIDVLNNTQEVYVYGKNYTGYHWDYESPTSPPYTEVNLFHKNTTYTYSTYCYDNTTSTTSRTVYKLVSWVVYIFNAFMLIYFVYWIILQFSDKVLKGRKMK